MKNILLFLLLATFFLSCSFGRGLDRAALRNQLSSDTVKSADSSAQITKRLPSPFKLAVFFSYPKMPENNQWDSWKWSDEDRKIFSEICIELKSRGIVSDSVIITDKILEGANRDSVRLAASKAGADAILIISGIADIDRYTNVFGLSYVLLVTAFFIPGSVSESVFIADASLIDVRDSNIYFSSGAEETVKINRPIIFMNEKTAREKAKYEVLKKLKDDVVEKLNDLSNK